MGMGESLFFYDALFGYVNFDREIMRIDPTERIFKGEDPNGIFKDLLKTYEMTRQLFIKQSGLCFLEYPSATHNRFSHSIGCWLIGTYALESVRVFIEGEYEKLVDWLARQDCVFEFLVSLLVHDCGHGPFSHLLEYNAELDFDHERMTREMVLGEGTYAKLVSERAGSIPTVHEVLDEYDVNKCLVAGLTSLSDDEFEKHFEKHLIPIKDLVDSKIDIDKLDHCLRDIKYFGIGLEMNINAFLENIVLYPWSSNPTRVKSAGIPHIFNLLYCREFVWLTALTNPKVEAYSTMLNYALTRMLERDELAEEDVVLFTDDELLNRLRESRDKDVRDMYSRVVGRKPYLMVHQCMVSAKAERREIEEKLQDVRRKLKVDERDLLLYAPFRERPKKPTYWLLVTTEDGKELSDTHPGLNRALWDMEDMRNRTIKFFASPEVARSADVRKTLQDVF